LTNKHECGEEWKTSALRWEKIQKHSDGICKMITLGHGLNKESQKSAAGKFTSSILAPFAVRFSISTNRHVNPK
jgi:hypothetical protein